MQASVNLHELYYENDVKDPGMSVCALYKLTIRKFFTTSGQRMLPVTLVGSHAILFGKWCLMTIS